MENEQDNQEKAADPTPETSGVAKRISAQMLARGRAVGQALPRLGLFAFILLTPLLITGYPAYFVTAKLLDYAAATTVEAKLNDIEIKTVTTDGRDSSLFSDRRHIEVAYSFRAENRKHYVAIQRVSWPAPGLQRKMDQMYEPGDTFILYLMPNEDILLDQEVAKDSFLWLTALMGLIFAAFTLFFLEWKRLYRLKPNVMPPVPLATAKSIGIGQLTALILAIVQAVIVAHAPVTIPIAVYLGIYWGVVIFLSLLLRLLLFENPVAEPEPEQDQAKSRPSGQPHSR